MSLNIGEALISLVTETDFNDLPENVVEEAKRRLLDFIGVTLAGATQEESIIAQQVAGELGGLPEATIIGHRARTSAPLAALVNAITGHVLELDDVYTIGILHPSVVVVPAALASGESEGINGRQLLTSIVIGYEVATRLARSINPSHRARGFHATGTCGTIASAAVAAHNMRLAPRNVGYALGLAATQAAGLLEFRAMSKRLNAGHAGYAGIISALLARHGFIGSVETVNREGRFFSAFTDASKADESFGDLRQKYEIFCCNVKFHACCGYFHSAIDAVLEIARNGVSPEDVERVQVKTFRMAVDGHQEVHPKALVEATMSLPFSVATAFIHGRAGMNEFAGEAVNDVRTTELARRVELIVDPTIDSLFPNRWAAEVEVYLRDGTVRRLRVDVPKGTYPDRPVPQRELEAKFEALTEGVLTKDRQTGITRCVKEVDTLDNIRELTALL